MTEKEKVEWLVFDAKVETPTEKICATQRNIDEPKGFVGVGAKASAEFITVRLQGQINEDIKTKLEGPAIAASLGATAGSENSLAAIVEPSLVKTEATYKNIDEPKGFVGVGAKASAEFITVRLESQINEDIKTKLEGPAIAASLGATAGSENSLAAIVEPSLVKTEATYKVTDNFSLYASVGLNATTGLKINEEGVKFGLLGFGLTLGVGGKWEINTPLVSVGGGTACAMTWCTDEELQEFIRSKGRNAIRSSPVLAPQHVVEETPDGKLLLLQ